MTANTFSPVVGKAPAKKIEPLPPGSSIAVIGAGAFGGWASLFLLRQHYKVTLIDAWGPGHSRSSSGDETRVIRSTYGANEFYFDLNVRALTLWKEHEQRWNRKLFQNKGILWMCYDEKTPLVDDSIPFAKKHKMEYEKLSAQELAKRYPIVNTEDIHHGYLDPYGGCLRAREACQAVQKAFRDEGGTYIQAYALPGKIDDNKLTSVKLSNGQSLKADCFIFSCGSWLGKIFPDVLGQTITCTKQEVYYFGVPPDQAQAYENFPVWVDVDGKDFYYGIPGNAYRGFKIGVDERGVPFDPTSGERIADTSVLAKARKFIAHRFPGLAHAPLVENRVCPYENSPDGNFIFDHHPEAGNLFFLGGGSGHGFKHGPALGELISAIVSGEAAIPVHFLLAK
ncbi:MAG: FAD-dependent oxidoreductase [Cyclobacteriaceae bacterium]|nr:FAD-dependent oxidoreductase [Cyclobacteriaceae bacterium]UYN87847.1 MAG: FAD-dependent oxidoreductase [Cyclobacteriaceae bacterium]